MKSLNKKVLLGYLIFTVLYFLLSYVFFEPSASNTKNIITAILTSLGDLLYWLTVITSYLISILVSAIVGMIVFRNNRQGFIAFRAVAIGSVVLLIFGIIASYF